MAVMARETWSDERLTYFEKRVDERFDRVDERFDHFERSVDERFDRVDEKFAEVNAEFRRIDKRFDRVEGDIRELRQMMERMNAKMTTGFIGLAGLIVSQALFF